MAFIKAITISGTRHPQAVIGDSGGGFSSLTTVSTFRSIDLGNLVGNSGFCGPGANRPKQWRRIWPIATRRPLNMPERRHMIEKRKPA